MCNRKGFEVRDDDTNDLSLSQDTDLVLCADDINITVLDRDSDQIVHKVNEAKEGSD